MRSTATTIAPAVLIRPAAPTDAAAVARLAELDSRPVPGGELLLAEADGELVAAYSLQTGASIADPFRPSGDVAALLELHARPRRPARRRRAPRLRIPLAHPRTA